jgi:hypothetical protein
VRACLERAEQDGCTRVRLSSQEDMTAAHRLYERLGFVRTPERDWSPVPGLRLRTYALELSRAAVRPPAPAARASTPRRPPAPGAARRTG